MKMEVRRYCIAIIPENDTDTAYIEEVLGMRKDGDTATVKRNNAINLLCMGNLEISRDKRRDEDGPH